MQALQHPWDVTPAQARTIQVELASRVEREDRIGPVRHVAGVDVGFEERGRVTRAAVAVLAWPGLELVAQAVTRMPTCFPYVPGLLSFREVPAISAVLQRLTFMPDLILCDGQGIAHPRRCGIACHLGLLMDIPTIGVAKTRLTGEYGMVPARRGAWTPLTDRDEVIGAVLRTRGGVKPLFVSGGHRVGLPSAIAWVMACTGRYRLPETTRHAHRLASGPA